MNERKSGGFSLRQSLIEQGVTTEDGIRAHLVMVAGIIQAVPDTDVTKYRVNKRTPNIIYHG